MISTVPMLEEWTMMSRRLIGFSLCGSASRILNFHFSSLLFTGLYTKKPGTLMVVSGVAKSLVDRSREAEHLGNRPRLVGVGGGEVGRRHLDGSVGVAANVGTRIDVAGVDAHTRSQCRRPR